MAEIVITFCNSAYAHAWFKNFERQSPAHFMMVQAIINEILAKDGGDILKGDILRRNPEVQKHVIAKPFDMIPSRGQLLKHNGNGIRHAKFSPSKSIAIVWEKIGDKIFITFDDHAPIQYHRAIRHFRDIKLGKPTFPKRPRNTGRFFKDLKTYKRYRYKKGWKGVNLKDLYYE